MKTISVGKGSVLITVRNDQLEPLSRHHITAICSAILPSLKDTDTTLELRFSSFTYLKVLFILKKTVGTVFGSFLLRG